MVPLGKAEAKANLHLAVAYGAQRCQTIRTKQVALSQRRVANVLVAMCIVTLLRHGKNGRSLSSQASRENGPTTPPVHMRGPKLTMLLRQVASAGKVKGTRWDATRQPLSTKAALPDKLMCRQRADHCR